MMGRLTKPLREAITVALDAALGGDGFNGGDFDGMDRAHFERAHAWIGEQPTTQSIPATTREGEPDEITVSAEYVQRSLSWIDGLDAHEGLASTQNVNDLIAIAREFAKGYGEHAAILKHVIADRERIKGERNDASERADSQP